MKICEGGKDYVQRKKMTKKITRHKLAKDLFVFYLFRIFYLFYVFRVFACFISNILIVFYFLNKLSTKLSEFQVFAICNWVLRKIANFISGC